MNATNSFNDLIPTMDCFFINTKLLNYLYLYFLSYQFDYLSEGRVLSHVSCSDKKHSVNIQ